MQLLLILALLLYGGKGSGNILSEVKPVLESIGGEEMRAALKNAEEISSVLSAVQGLAGASAPSVSSAQTDNVSREESTVNFPLAPVSAIADKDITYSLSKYIAQN